MSDEIWSPVVWKVRPEALEAERAKERKDFALIEFLSKNKDHVGPHCEKVSPGCDHCVAETRNVRRGTGLPFTRASRDLIVPSLDLDILRQPYWSWRIPRKVWVQGDGDLFVPWVEDEWIDEVFQVTERARKHEFYVCTKYAERLAAWAGNRKFPKNVLIGVSVENQETANRRIPELIKMNALVRFVCYEPALAEVDFSPWLGKLQWLIIGGEYGGAWRGARKFDVNWARKARMQCREHGVAYYMRQLGSSPYDGDRPLYLKRRNGDDPDEWDREFRIREFPFTEQKTARIRRSATMAAQARAVNDPEPEPMEVVESGVTTNVDGDSYQHDRQEPIAEEPQTDEPLQDEPEPEPIADEPEPKPEEPKIEEPEVSEPAPPAEPELQPEGTAEEPQPELPVEPEPPTPDPMFLVTDSEMEEFFAAGSGWRSIDRQTNPDELEKVVPAVVPAVTEFTKAELDDVIVTIEDHITSNVTLPNQNYPFVIALWALATHCQMSFHAFAFMVVNSKTNEEGKSILMEILEPVSKDGKRPTPPTLAQLCEIIDKKTETGGCTIFWDEAKMLNKKDDDPIVAVLLSSYKKGTPRGLMRGGVPIEQQVYCAKVFGCIGPMSQSFMSRSIVIPTKYVPDKFRPEYFPPEAAERGKRIGALCEAAIKDRIKEIEHEIATVARIEFLSGRQREIFLPLFIMLKIFCPERYDQFKLAVTDLRSAEWGEPERRSPQEVRITRERRVLGKMLLVDLIFVCGVATFIWTHVALPLLKNIVLSPWRNLAGVGLTDTKLAQLLKPYGIEPRPIKRSAGTFRGYFKAELERALALHFPEDTDDTPTF